MQSIQKPIPLVPLILQTSLSTIDESMTAEQAKGIAQQIEGLYNAYYADTALHQEWTWNEVHDLDRDALIELEEVVRASKNPPLDLDLVQSFRTEAWRNYSYVSSDKTKPSASPKM